MCLAIITITAHASPHYITLSIHFGDCIFPKTPPSREPRGGGVTEAGDGRLCRWSTFDLAVAVALAPPSSDLMRKEKDAVGGGGAWGGSSDGESSSRLRQRRICSLSATVWSNEEGSASPGQEAEAAASPSSSTHPWTTNGTRGGWAEPPEGGVAAHSAALLATRLYYGSAPLLDQTSKTGGWGALPGLGSAGHRRHGYSSRRALSQTPPPGLRGVVSSSAS